MAKQKDYKPLKEIVSPIIYIGPSFKGLQSGTIFSNGMPAVGNTLVAKHTKYKRLFVAPKDYTKTVKELNNNGGLSLVYKSAMNEVI